MVRYWYDVEMCLRRVLATAIILLFQLSAGKSFGNESGKTFNEGSYIKQNHTDTPFAGEISRKGLQSWLRKIRRQSPNNEIPGCAKDDIVERNPIACSLPEAESDVAIACFADFAFGQLNNFLVSTIHALLAARAAGRLLAVREHVPCETGDGFVLAEILEIDTLRAAAGHCIVVLTVPMYDAACSTAPVAPLAQLRDFGARAVRVDAADAFYYRRFDAADMRRTFAGIRFPARIRRRAADYVRATFGGRAFGAVHLRTCSDTVRRRLHLAGIFAVGIRPCVCVCVRAQVDFCARNPHDFCAAEVPARAFLDSVARIRATARHLRRAGAPVPPPEGEAAVAPMCWLDPAWVAAAVARSAAVALAALAVASSAAFP